ncbi:MAG TPA: hypothetical protein VGB82_07230 [Alphaproteobacteria bacterium]
MKPIEPNVSPYLQQPLRTLEQVRQERERRQREQADAGATPAPAAATPKTDIKSDTAPAVSPTRVDQTA